MDHEEAFQKAKDLGLNITIHAGEVGEIEYVERAVRDYGATRIGHGYRIASNDKLMDEMKRLNIHFEACPTSSLETGGWEIATEEEDWKLHPAVKMFEHGLRLVSFVCSFSSYLKIFAHDETSLCYSQRWAELR